MCWTKTIEKVLLEDLYSSAKKNYLKVTQYRSSTGHFSKSVFLDPLKRAGLWRRIITWKVRIESDNEREKRCWWVQKVFVTGWKRSEEFKREAGKSDQIWFVSNLVWFRELNPIFFQFVTFKYKVWGALRIWHTEI